MAQETTKSPVFKAYYEIPTPRLIIRSAVPEDAEAIYRLFSTKDNNPHTPQDPELTVETYTRRIGRWTEAAQKGESAFMVIILRENNELIGFGGFNSLPKKPALHGSSRAVLVGDIGVMIDNRYWRKGYASEAVCAKSEFGFNYFGVGYMSMDTQQENTPFQKMTHAIGLGETEKLKYAEYRDAMYLFYEWDSNTWEKAKTTLKARGKWPL